MDNVNVVTQAMIDELRGTNTITIDIDSGDKEFKLNSHFESMLDIGAFAIAHSRATTVRITAFDDDNKKKVIDFRPESGEFLVITNEWGDNTPSSVIIDIHDPTDPALWEAIDNYDLTVEISGVSWMMKGKRSDLVKFITKYYVVNDEEVSNAYIRDIKIDVMIH